MYFSPGSLASISEYSIFRGTVLRIKTFLETEESSDV